MTSGHVSVRTHTYTYTPQNKVMETGTLCFKQLMCFKERTNERNIRNYHFYGPNLVSTAQETFISAPLLQPSETLTHAHQDLTHPEYILETAHRFMDLENSLKKKNTKLSMYPILPTPGPLYQIIVGRALEQDFYTRVQ